MLFSFCLGMLRRDKRKVNIYFIDFDEYFSYYTGMDIRRKPIKGEDAFRKYLRRECESSESYAVFAKEHGISPSQLSNLLGGYGCIGAKTAAKFGYVRVDSVTFVPNEKEPG